MSRVRAHFKVHLSVLSHPKMIEVVSDPRLFATWVRLGMLAVERYAARTGDRFAISSGDLLAVTGASNPGAAMNAVQALVRRSPVRIEPRGSHFVVTFPNLARKQGLSAAEEPSGKAAAETEPSRGQDGAESQPSRRRDARANHAKSQRFVRKNGTRMCASESESDSEVEEISSSGGGALPVNSAHDDSRAPRARARRPRVEGAPAQPAQSELIPGGESGVGSDRAPPAWALELADLLAQHVGSVPGGRIPRGCRLPWAREIARIPLEVRSFRGAWPPLLRERIEWLFGPENLGREFEIVVRSGRSLREKWPKIEAAVRRRAREELPRPSARAARMERQLSQYEGRSPKEEEGPVIDAEFEREP